jgi:hypothetical protein
MRLHAHNNHTDNNTITNNYNNNNNNTSNNNNNSAGTIGMRIRVGFLLCVYKTTYAHVVFY